MGEPVREDVLEAALEAWRQDAEEDEAEFLERWRAHVEEHGLGGETTKHLGGQHNQLSHGRRYSSGKTTPGGKRIPDAHDNFEAKLLEREQKLIAETGLTGAIKKAHPDMDEQTLLAYADVMSLDRKRFVLYGNKLGMENVEQQADEFFDQHNRIRRQIANDRAELRIRQTLQQYDTDGYLKLHAAADRLHDAPQRFESSVDAASYLGQKHEISVIMHPDVDEKFMAESLNHLANTLDTYPLVAQHFRDQGGRVDFVPRKQGESHLARWVSKGVEVPNRISGGSGTIVGPLAWVHEIGHGAENYAGSGNVLNRFDRGRRISSYAWRNAFEDWAETYAAIVFSQGGMGLRDWFPGKFDYMVENVPGFEDFIQEAAGG